MGAAVRFFRKVLKGQGAAPRLVVTDKRRSYSAACRTMMPSVAHCADQGANNHGSLAPTELIYKTQLQNTRAP